MENILENKGRFVKTFTKGSLSIMEIWVDRETGVNYLFRSSGYAGGLCPLLDAAGRPVVTPVSELERSF